MPPKRQRTLNLDRFPFIFPFLNQEWEIVEGERGNKETIFNASSDLLWLSLQNYFERNGYSENFCNKIIFGKLLSQCGLSKIKRGPRRNQKIFYFPLRPRNGTEAERLFRERKRSQCNLPVYRSPKNFEPVAGDRRYAGQYLEGFPKLPEVKGLTIKVAHSQTLITKEEKRHKERKEGRFARQMI